MLYRYLCVLHDMMSMIVGDWAKYVLHTLSPWRSTCSCVWIQIKNSSMYYLLLSIIYLQDSKGIRRLRCEKLHNVNNHISFMASKICHVLIIKKQANHLKRSCINMISFIIFTRLFLITNGCMVNFLLHFKQYLFSTKITF